MVPPFIKQFFKKFNGSGVFGKTVTAIGTANQITVTAERTGRGTGTLTHDEFMAAKGTSIFQFIVHNNQRIGFEDSRILGFKGYNFQAFHSNP